MKRKWTKIISQVVADFDNVNQIKCPNCGEYGIDYMYIGDVNTRVGFLQIWCKRCLKGIYVSRAVAPSNAKFVAFDTNLNGIVPKFEFVED